MRQLRILCLVLVLPALVLAADWPGWLGPNRDGSSPEKVEPWKEPLKVAWRVKVGEAHSSPIVVGDRVYLHTRQGKKDAEKVAAYNLADGKEVWSQSYERGAFKAPFGGGPRGTPLYDDGKLYTYGITGILTCWDAAKGDQVWQIDTLKQFQGKNLTFGLSSSPLIVGDKLLLNVGAPGASLVAFNKKNGETVWKMGDAAPSYASPIAYKVGSEQEVLFFTAKGLQAVDPATGKTRWSYPLVDVLNESSTTPVKMGDLFLASSITYGTVGLTRQQKEEMVEAKQAWKNPSLTCYFSTPVVVGDYIYLATGQLGFTAQANLHCVDPKTGKALWTKEKVGKYHAALVRTGNDKLLMLDDFGNVSLLDPSPEAFKELAKTKICGQTWVTPALSGGKVVLRDDNELICIELPK
jgi:outer membrane protein assembly factor BamB